MYKVNNLQIIPEPVKYDPWEARQEIASVRIEIHCSRYWMLSEWECNDLSLPFWRIYHSRLGGSYVYFEGNEIELTNELMLLIPPYTSFSSYINAANREVESIKGLKIAGEDEISIYAAQGLKDQFFVHFNLGYPYDKIEQNLYVCELNEYWKNELRTIENERLSNPNTISFYSSMKLNSVLLYALQFLKPTMWYTPVSDKRITRVIKFIDENIGTELQNSKLSEVANMATNSFARLFKKGMQLTVQQYIQQKRIDKSIMLFHHSSLGIDEIACKCGFYDRHHFSSVFKKQTGYSPARYRLRIGVITDA